jgi:hypothetical protein
MSLKVENAMFKQLRRIWSDDGRNDKDFTPQELRLKTALNHLKNAADNLSRATEDLLYVINRMP